MILKKIISKNESYLIIEGINNYGGSFKRLLLSIVSGKKTEDCIYAPYTNDLVFKIIKFLNKKEIDYSYDRYIGEAINIKSIKDREFMNHSENALEIKNALKNDNENYLNFIKHLKKNMTRRLFDYQLRSAYHMAFSLNSCNFSVPGTGKTTIVYAAFSYIKTMKNINKLIIIGPLSSRRPWIDEYYKNFGKEPDLFDLSSVDKETKIDYLESHVSMTNEIVFINYEGLRTVEESISKYVSSYKSMIVLDEAHKIKNPNALRSRSIMNIAKMSDSRIILTGTPMPNGYPDLYNLFEFIWPEKNVLGFSLIQLDKINDNQSIIVSKLMENISPYYIRIKKSDLNLPKATFNKPYLIDMAPKQSQIYQFIAEDFLKVDYEGTNDDLRIELKKAKLIRLMQSLTDPSAISKSIRNRSDVEGEMYDLIINYRKYETPNKYIKVLELIKKIINRNEKVIIWTSFTHVLKSLRKYLKDNNVSSKLLYGSNTNDEREEIIIEFHNNPELKVLIANPAAVAESISLHKVCHNAIYLDKTFNASHYMQSKDRIHRVGLPKEAKVNYYYFISRNTVDEVIHNRVLEKETNMLNIIEGSKVPLFSNDFDSDFSEKDIHTVEEYLKKSIREI